MKTSTKRVLFLFVLSVGSLVGGLFYPLYNHSQEGRRLTYLTSILQEKEKYYAQRMAMEGTHARNVEKIAVMKQQGFFDAVDEKEILEKIDVMGRVHKIRVTSLHIGEPVKESAESWRITHWPVQVEFSAHSEENIDRIIEFFQKDLPGLVIPKELLIIQKKRHAFWVKYGFGVVQTNHSVGSQVSEPRT
jgi:hypothetical protein